MFSSKSDEWGTPTSFFNKLNKRFDFTLDPCSTPNNKKCDKFYTIEDDGLSKSWKNERVFVNPPYGNIAAWVEKAYLESCKGAFVALLIPSRTDTKYWHDFIMPSASHIYFIRGRLKFENGSATNNAAPFPSVVVTFGGMRWGVGPTIQTITR
tara:strand:- start:768 stop:1226 length:459 start_codon:yes stop_codon:yes gene_type:complete